MSTRHTAVVQLIAEIQAETLELDNLRRRGARSPDLAAKQRMLERLPWGLAAVARRAAQGDPGDAA
jgi:hypothetical protein